MKEGKFTLSFANTHFRREQRRIEAIKEELLAKSAKEEIIRLDRDEDDLMETLIAEQAVQKAVCMFIS